MLKKEQSMDDIIHRLDRSAELVKTWGKQISNGQTVSEVFTFNGIPLWNALSVDLARVFVPETLSPVAVRRSWFNRRVKPQLGVFKRKAQDYLLNHKHRGAPAKWPSDPFFLFLGFGDYLYRDVLKPVVDCLAKQQVVILNDQPHQTLELGDNESQYFRSVWQYLDVSVRETVKKTYKEFLLVRKEIMASEIFFEVLDDHEHACWPQMQDRLNWYFCFYMPRFLSFFIIAQNLLECYPPSLIISADVADPRSRIYCLLGQKMGLPVLQLQFGTYGKDAIEWQFFEADRLAVWGESSRNVMIGHGVSDSQIVVTGSPRHDYLIGTSPKQVSQTRQKFQIPKGKIVILFASVYYLKEYANSDPEQYNALIMMKKALFQAVGRCQDLHMVVKPHPQEDVSETQKLTNSEENIQFVDQWLDIRDLINACDCFVSLGSSATVDALIANKLIILPFFSGWGWSSEALVEDGVGLVPRSKVEIDQVFDKLEQGHLEGLLRSLSTNRDRFLKNWLFKVDGLSTNRVVDLAFDLSSSVGTHLKSK